MTVPVHAFASIDINTTLAVDYPNTFLGFDCTNVTGTTYCYGVGFCNGAGTGGHWCVYRTNSTLGDLKECDAISNWPWVKGFTVINSTHMAIRGHYADQLYITDISNIGTNTSCPIDSIIPNIYADSHIVNLGTYYPDGYNANYSYVYTGTYSGGVSNATGFSAGVFLTRLFNLSDELNDKIIYSIVFPDETDNTSAYGLNVYANPTIALLNTSNFYKIDNGVITKEFDNLWTIYGFPQSNNILGFDFFKESDSTTWLYAYFDQRAYRMNWTAIDNETYSEDYCGGYTDGAWCDDYNLTMACIYTNDIQPCYETNDEPNPFDATKRAFTIYNTSEEDCLLADCTTGLCPIDYMCVQYFNPVTKEHEAKVQCYNGQNADVVYYNETCQEFDGINYTINITADACETPDIFNNSWTCSLNYCYWCSKAQLCTFDADTCDILIYSSECTNTSTTCYNQYCNHIICDDDQIQELSNWLDDSLDSQFGSELTALLFAGIISGVFFVYSGDKKHKKLEYFIIPMLFILACFSLVGMFPIWFLLLEVLMIAMFMFFKVKGG